MTLWCKLTAYQFDSAVVTFGTIVSNRAQETVEVGAGDAKRRVPKYDLVKELLNPDFLLPREGDEGGDAPLPVGVDGAIVDEVKG